MVCEVPENRRERETQIRAGPCRPDDPARRGTFGRLKSSGRHAPALTGGMKMSDDPQPPPIGLTYRIPADDRSGPPGPRRWRATRFDVVGIVIGVWQIAWAVFFFDGNHFVRTEGPWFPGLMWYEGPGIPVICNGVGAVIAVVAAIGRPLRRRTRYRVFAWCCLATLVSTWAGMALVTRWPIYVTHHPLDPPVNDHRLIVPSEAWRLAPVLIVFANPMLIVRLSARGDRAKRLKYLRRARELNLVRSDGIWRERPDSRG